MWIDGWGSRTAPYGLRCTVHHQMAVEFEREGRERERERERETGDKGLRNFSTIKLSNLPPKHVHVKDKHKFPLIKHHNIHNILTF
jgi:hypothetical protein